VALASCPVTLACGEGDGMVSVGELREFRADAVELRGIGHNAHVEAPEVALGLLEPRLAAR
jgi:pimeloyl-ACP methyl ester carboxylesterase